MRRLFVLVALAGCGFEVSTLSVDARMTQSDAALPACPSSPANCIPFTCAASTSCYYYCPQAQRSFDAQTRCQMIPNGCLVTLDDVAEDVCVRMNVGGTSLIHIGLIQTSGAPEPAGGWGWRCGMSTYGPNWTGSEPNDGGGGEDCGTMTTAGGWVDVGCFESFRFVCEVPR